MKPTLSHIVFCLDYYLPYQWWAEKVFGKLVEKLIADEVTVSIITTKHTQTVPDKEQIWWATIYRVWHKRTSWFFCWWRKARKIFTWLMKQKNQPQLIHTSTIAVPIIAWCLGKWANIPVTLTVHELFGALWKKAYPRSHRLYRWYEKFLCTIHFDTIVTVSTFTYKSVLQHNPSSPIERIYNGIDQKFSTISKWWVWSHDQPLKVLYFGHCWFSKWIDEYLTALPTIAEQYPRTQFIFSLLPSKNTSRIIKKLKCLQKQYTIHLHQNLPQEKLFQQIDDCHAIIVPSLSEWFGLAAAEASATKKILITTQFGALPEVVFWKVIFLDDHSTQSFLNARKKLIHNSYTTIPKKIFDRSICYQDYKTLRKNLLSKK